MNKEKYFIKAALVLIAFILIFACGIIAGFIYLNTNIREIVMASGNETVNANNAPPPKIQIPILMYHNFVENSKDVTEASIEIKKFNRDIEYISRNGFTTIFFQDLIDYVYEGVSLPEKPIIITMDDGYLSNYTSAFPILKEHNTKATSFVVGSSMMGYSEHDLIPHFNAEQAKEMLLSGVVDIQSHSFDFHRHTYYGSDRDGATKSDIESFDKYYKLFENDCERMKAIFMRYFDTKPQVFSYPYGEVDWLSEELFEKMGYKATVLSHEEGFSFIQYGSPNTLFGLKRISINNDLTMENALKNLNK